MFRVVFRALLLVTVLFVGAHGAVEARAAFWGDPFVVNETFAKYLRIGQQTPILSPEDFEPIKESLIADGFTEVPEGGTWVFSDRRGKVRVTCFPEGRTLTLKVSWKSPVPLGDAVVAALIEKAESVLFHGTAGLLLTMPRSQIQWGSRFGNMEHFMWLMLPDLKLLGVGVTILWQEPPN